MPDSDADASEMAAAMGDLPANIDPETCDPALLERVAALHADPGTDFDARTRQAAGWLRFYVECPDCLVPMARTQSDTEDIPAAPDQQRTRRRIHALCPACGAVETVLTVYETTQPFGRFSVSEPAGSERRAVPADEAEPVDGDGA